MERDKHTHPTVSEASVARAGLAEETGINYKSFDMIATINVQHVHDVRKASQGPTPCWDQAT